MKYHYIHHPITECSHELKIFINILARDTATKKRRKAKIRKMARFFFRFVRVTTIDFSIANEEVLKRAFHTT